MGNEIIRTGLILVVGFALACFSSPISERQRNEGKSCTLACLTKKLTPVCGSDGRTYKNPCMLNAQNCGSSTKVVEELYEGICTTEPTVENCKKLSDKTVGCPERIDPLCGQDQHTYLNYCQLLRLNCEYKIGIGVAHRGACDADRTGDAKASDAEYLGVSTVLDQPSVNAETVPISQAAEVSSGGA